MKNSIKYIVSLALLFAVSDAWAWSDMGHNVISVLATERLTPEAKKRVEKILGGDIRSNALWLNTLKKGDMAAQATEWHNTTLAADGRSVTTDENDGIVLLERNIQMLRNGDNLSREEAQRALRTVIHLVQDLHCLAHVRFEDIPHSSNFTFYRPYKGRTDNIKKCPKQTWYRMWATWYFDMRAAFSAEMFAEEIRLVQGDKFEAYASGSPREWVEDMGRVSRPILEVVKPNQIVLNAYLFNLEPTHESCVAKAAVRLAVVLNEIFK